MILQRKDENGQLVDPDKAPKRLIEAATHLKSAIPQHEAIFHSKRTDYFKGERAIDTLINKHASMSREEASSLLSDLVDNSFFFRVKKQRGRSLEVDQQQFFEEDAYFIWQWETPYARLKSQVLSFGLLAVVLMVIMFPLWPVQLRVGVWYLSMGGIGLIGLLFVVALLRLVLFVGSLAVPQLRPGFWLYPNLFADVGFFDSFRPVWGWQGVDYERQHLEKYRRESRRGKKAPASDSPAAAPAKKSSGKEPLLTRVAGEPKIVELVSDDEGEVEEISAD
eukprot:Partr_v1_DN24634_c0_g1_i1_m59604 putative translocation protein